MPVSCALPFNGAITQAGGLQKVFIKVMTLKDACQQEGSRQQDLSKQLGPVEWLQAHVV